MFVKTLVIFSVVAITQIHSQSCLRPSNIPDVSTIFFEVSVDGGATLMPLAPTTQNFTIGQILRITCLNLAKYLQATCVSAHSWSRPFDLNCSDEASFSVSTLKPAYYWPLNRISERNDIIPGSSAHFTGGQMHNGTGPYRNFSQVSYYINGDTNVIMTANIMPEINRETFTFSFYFKHMSQTLTSAFLAINYALASDFIGFRTSQVVGQFIFKNFNDSFKFSTDCGDAYNRWIFWTITYAKPGLYAWCDNIEAYNNTSVSAAFIVPNTSAVLSLGKNTINSGANEGAMSCLSIYWGIVNGANARETIKKHCETVGSVEPHPNVPTCSALTNSADCTSAELLLDKSLSLGNLAYWRLRGGAWLSSASLSIKLMPTGPSQYGSMWAQTYQTIPFDSTWRLEIYLTQLVTYGTFGLFLYQGAGETQGNLITVGSFKFGFDPAVFVGLAIFIDMDSQRIDIVTATAANPAWLTIEQMRASPTLSHNLDCSPKAPFDMIVLEYLPRALTLVTSNKALATSSETYQTDVMADLETLAIGTSEGLLGVGMYSRSDATSTFDAMTEATAVLAINYYQYSLSPEATLNPAAVTPPVCSTTTSTSTSTTTTTATSTTTTTTPMTELTTDTTTSSPTESTTRTVRVDEFFEIEYAYNITFEEDLYLPVSQRNISATDPKPFDGWDVLTDRNDPLFRELENVIKPPICELYANISMAHSCEILRFSHGSIIADYVVALKSLTQLSDAEIDEKVQQTFGIAKSDPRSLLSSVSSIQIIKSTVLAVPGIKSATSKMGTAKSSKTAMPNFGEALGKSNSLLATSFLFILNFIYAA